MLQLIDITKSYYAGGFKQVALNKLNLNFRQREFVAICGPSGSGKTTCLNVIGGLDKYDNGDLIINGKSTKNFTDSEWDAYRNNSVGFVFQSYNLITHLNVLNNVEIGMTLSGVSAKVRHSKAMELLDCVGLKEHMYKRPNQLSGGQMQRVAIARALANDPDIIMMDKPTGALDTATSVQIMDLIKEISSEKLVIMVTHNIELAEKYASRVVRFQDGRVTSDTNPYTVGQELSDYESSFSVQYAQLDPDVHRGRGRTRESLGRDCPSGTAAAIQSGGWGICPFVSRDLLRTGLHSPNEHAKARSHLSGHLQD